MPTRLIVAADAALAPAQESAARDLCASLATILNDTVLFTTVDADTLDDLRAWTLTRDGKAFDRYEPRVVSAAPMTSADFVFKDDGRPDWSAMWATFCDLALYGGPPHRGAGSALEATAADDAPVEEYDAIAEIRRGIWETTGLFTEPAEPGWLAVSCASRRMAAWLCAAIILENVDARCDEERLLVPASPSFRLKDEVKSVITVVAKTHHYWSAHTQEQEALAGRAEA